jgi:SET domain-containing protein
MQKNHLNFSSKIEVRKSNIGGFGVFAKEPIFKGEILEESPFLTLPSFILSAKGVFDSLKNQNLLCSREKYKENLAKNLGLRDAEEYYFKWMPDHQLDGEQIVYTVLPLGFGPIYNSSNSGNNAEWAIDKQTFIFKASKDIQRDEEICTFYGYFLDEKGTKFECDDVYNLGLDYFDGKVGFKSIRFGSIESHLAAKNNPFFVELISLISQTKSTIYLKKIYALDASNKEQASISIPEDVSLKDLFNKLKECKYSSFSQIKFIFEFIDKTNGLTKEQTIVFKR